MDGGLKYSHLFWCNAHVKQYVSKQAIVSQPNEITVRVYSRSIA